MKILPGETGHFPFWNCWDDKGKVTVYVSGVDKACIVNQRLDRRCLGT
jgi:hypothetical protein